MSGFLLQIFSALIVSVLLELWRAKRQKHRDVPSHNPWHPFRLGAWIRLITAPVLGFFLAAISAGFIEAFNEPLDIPLDSTLAIGLIIAWTLVCWYGLSRFGRQPQPMTSLSTNPTPPSQDSFNLLDQER